MANPSLKEFIAKSIQDINEGLPEGYELSDEIDFEITVLSTSGADNKIDLKVLQAGTNEKAEQAHKICFTIVNPSQQEKNALSNAKQAEKMISSVVMGMMHSFKGIEDKVATAIETNTKQ